jgi:tripartite-type tricarboxylate transporter receptor subunit TctC
MAQAQTWPDRTVTIVVPFGPGASNDIFTRAISQVLSKKLGQPFVVENRPGAGGFTGSYAVKRSPPDGYMFLEAMVVSLKDTMKVDLDQRTDLETVAVFARSSSSMMVPASLPVKTVAEFVEYAKKSPQPLLYGHTSKGDFAQLNAELFANLTGIKLKPVSYKSAADMGTDLIAGRTQVNFVSIASAVGNVKAGQLRLLAYVAKNESKSAPPAPTFADEGVIGMDKSQLWWVFYAPKGTPREIVRKMNEAINEATKDPSIIDLFDRSGVMATHYTPEESTAIVKRELDSIADIIKATGLTFDD